VTQKYMASNLYSGKALLGSSLRLTEGVLSKELVALTQWRNPQYMNVTMRSG
jgi:hypothetical protein